VAADEHVSRAPKVEVGVHDPAHMAHSVVGTVSLQGTLLRSFDAGGAFSNSRPNGVHRSSSNGIVGHLRGVSDAIDGFPSKGKTFQQLDYPSKPPRPPDA
jgi:hypothetical protein